MTMDDDDDDDVFKEEEEEDDDDDDDHDDDLHFFPERWQVLWIIDVKMIKLPFVKDVSFWTMDDQDLPCPLVKMPFFLAQQPAWIPTPPWTQEILYDTTLSRLNTLETYTYIYIYTPSGVIKHGNWKSTKIIHGACFEWENQL